MFEVVSSLISCAIFYQKVKFTLKKMAKSLLVQLLVSNIIDADHQNSCLFTIKGQFVITLWILIGVLAKFHE